MSLKSELKNGAVVETRNGNMYVKVDDTLLNINMSGMYTTLNIYLEDLKNKIDKNWDIVKVNNDTNNQLGYCAKAIADIQRNKWTWERPKEILDKAEKEYLSAAIKPFKGKILYIAKVTYLNEYYIRIAMLDDDEMNFPYIPSGSTMYKGMEVSKRYTLAELGL